MFASFWVPGKLSLRPILDQEPLDPSLVPFLSQDPHVSARLAQVVAVQLFVPASSALVPAPISSSFLSGVRLDPSIPSRRRHQDHQRGRRPVRLCFIVSSGISGGRLSLLEPMRVGSQLELRTPDSRGFSLYLIVG